MICYTILDHHLLKVIAIGDRTSYGTLDTPFTPPSHSYVTQNGEITNYGPNLTVVTNYVALINLQFLIV